VKIEEDEILRLTKRHLISYICLLILLAMLAMYRLPYYIYKPGGADALDEIVEVQDGSTSQGDMHLVTVSGGQATPLQWLWAKFSTYYEILPLETVRPKDMTEEDYRLAQLQMMENSQESSVVVAYEAAGKEIEMEYHGVYVVSVVDKTPAAGILDMGDRITEIDNQTINEADDLIELIDTKKPGDTVSLTVIRDDKALTETITLAAFKDPNGEEQVGMGIRLVTDRSVKVDPPVKFSSGNIGGPSAGLMFALEIYDQLTEEDLTKGYEIIGTGALDYDGTVQRIGGIDKKVVAADKAGCDIFFAPYEDGGEDSNYAVAKKTAEDINTKMEIVPVNTFDEALEYLEALEWKKD